METETAGAAGSEELPASSKKLKALRLLAFLVVPAFFIGFIGFTLLKTAPPSTLVGTQLPDFELKLLGTDDTLTAEDLAGKAVVVNFWASWCLPCKEEAPDLQAAFAKYEGQDVVVLGINVQDSEKDAVAFAEEYNITYPNVRDPNLTLYKALGVRGLPETFFVDKTGTFIGIGSGRQVGQTGNTKTLGAVDPALLESQIQTMLE